MNFITSNKFSHRHMAYITHFQYVPYNHTVPNIIVENYFLVPTYDRSFIESFAFYLQQNRLLWMADIYFINIAHALFLKIGFIDDDVIPSQSQLMSEPSPLSSLPYLSDQKEEIKTWKYRMKATCTVWFGAA